MNFFGYFDLTLLVKGWFDSTSVVQETWFDDTFTDDYYVPPPATAPYYAFVNSLRRRRAF